MGNSLKAKVVEEKPGQTVFLHFKVVEDKYGAFLLKNHNWRERIARRLMGPYADSLDIKVEDGKSLAKNEVLFSVSTKYTHEETKRNYKGDLNPDRLPDLEGVVMNIITDYDTVYKLYEFEIVHSDRLEKKLGDAKTMERFGEMAKRLADSHRK